MGGIGPWLKSTYQPLKITQKYSYTKAPHIVFVLVDDWGYNDFGLRSTDYNFTTPNINRLSNEGILLTKYETYHLCSPTRAALLTGRYSLRTGVTTVNGGPANTYGTGHWDICAYFIFI